MKNHKKIISALLVSSVFAFSACDKKEEIRASENAAVPAVILDWHVDFASAKTAAEQRGNDIFYIFTGTSWCPPCIHLETKIFSAAEFAEAAKAFELAKTVVERSVQANSESTLLELEKFNVTSFPTVFLLDSQALPYAVLTGASETPAEYLERISEAQKCKVARDEFFAKAKSLEDGAERAKALAEGLAQIPENVRKFYPEIVDEIIENDPEDSLGFAQKKAREELLKEQENELKALFEKCVGENGNRLVPESIDENIALISEFLDREGLLPEIRQQAFKFRGDNYGLKADLSNAEKMFKIRENFQLAIDADPESKFAKYLERGVEYYTKMLEEELGKEPQNEPESASEAEKTDVPENENSANVGPTE